MNCAKVLCLVTLLLLETRRSNAAYLLIKVLENSVLDTTDASDVITENVPERTDDGHPSKLKTIPKHLRSHRSLTIPSIPTHNKELKKNFDYYFYAEELKS